MASKESTAGRNRPTQVLVAGCCFIAVMCAIQVWRNNRLLDCGETVDAVFETPQMELPTATSLAQRDDVVFVPHALEPTVPPKFDVPTVREFSSALTEAERNISTLDAPARDATTMDGPTLTRSSIEFDNLDAAVANMGRVPEWQTVRKQTIQPKTDTTPTLSDSALERFASAAIPTPADMGHLVPSLVDVDFDVSVNEQMAELQTLEPSPPVAKQVTQSDITDLASNTKVTQPWPEDWELERALLQEREQQLLDEMIEEFEDGALKPEPDSRPIYRPEFDPSAEPIEPIEAPIEPQPTESLPRENPSPVEQESIPEPQLPEPQLPEPRLPEPQQPEPQQRLPLETPPVEAQPQETPPQKTQRSEPELPKLPDHSKNIATQSAWPRPNALFRSLDKLLPVFGVEDWSSQVREHLARLEQVPDVSDPASLEIFERLDELVVQSNPISQQLTSRMQQVAMRQSAYALARRLDVWKASHLATQSHHEALPHEVYHSVELDQMQQRVAEARQGLTRFRNSQSWADYLLLDQIEESAENRGPFAGAARAELAEIALDRLTDPNLSQQEMAFLKSLGLEALGQELRLWATHPVSQSDMLSALERFELEPTNPIKANRLANYRKDLYWSAVPSQNNVAAALDKHYRNANIRVSVNETMINRLVPAVRELNLPVRDNILGAQVKGQSRSRANIFVRLLPDRSRLRFLFETRGEMAAQTAATKGPVTLWNRNRSHFQVRKVVVMDQFGARLGRSHAVANGRSKLQGMRTKYDSYPILGSIVRKAAQRQHNETAGIARNIFVNRVEEQARQEVDRQIEQELASVRQQFQSKVFDPLRRMELNPRAVQMQTSADGRMVVRGRLAADHQLAAFTARPQAYRGSLLTMQIHESAMNNFLQQLNLDGRKANLKELYAELSQQLDLTPPDEPVDIPENITVQFAEKAALRVIVDEGKICLKIRIKSLKPDGERGWSNFEVAANYLPYRDEDSGMGFYFSRGEGISLTKKKRGGGIALRAIFTKVLSPNRKIHLVNPELVEDERFAHLNVTQMEIHNGWIGLSIGQGTPSPKVAIRPSRPQESPVQSR